MLFPCFPGVFDCAQVPQGNFSIHVYKDNDIVSRFLAGDSHSYEPAEVDEVLWALGQYTPKQQQQQPGQQQEQQKPGESMTGGPLMVDIGANVGTFLFKVAASGYRVAAFEGRVLPALAMHNGVMNSSSI